MYGSMNVCRPFVLMCSYVCKCFAILYECLIFCINANLCSTGNLCIWFFVNLFMILHVEVLSSLLSIDCLCCSGILASST